MINLQVERKQGLKGTVADHKFTEKVVFYVEGEQRIDFCYCWL